MKIYDKRATIFIGICNKFNYDVSRCIFMYTNKRFNFFIVRDMPINFGLELWHTGVSFSFFSFAIGVQSLRSLENE